MTSTRREPQRVSEQAVQWLCELADADPAREEAFFAWLRKSPHHVEEFLFATATWRRLRELGAGQRSSVDEVLAELRSSGDEGNVVSFGKMLDEAPASASRARPRAADRSWRRARWAAAAAIVAVMIALGFQAYPGAEVYETSVGEQRTVPLPDGSVLYLNTASRARLKFSQQSREIALLSGEALFTVARDAARPFRVIAGSAVVQAVGTQFNVRQSERGTRVSVLEGRVKVTHRTRPLAQPIDDPGEGAVPKSGTVRATIAGAGLLDAGEEATVAADGGIVRHASADVTRAVAWRERRVVFRTERLENVAEELNRYGTRRFRVIGDRARSIRLTATFDVDSPESLVSFLQRYGDLSVSADGEGFVIRDGAPAGPK